MRRGLVAALALAALAGGCSRGSAEEPPAVPPSSSPLDPRTRELAVPALEPGERCPRTPGKWVSRLYGPALGIGPAYPVGLGTKGILQFARPERFESEEWGGQKVLWVVDPRYDGPVLIRGRQLDGANEVRFDEGDIPREDIWLPAEDAGGKRWRERPSYTRVRAPGCYAYQIDGTNFSFIVVFEARPMSE